MIKILIASLLLFFAYTLLMSLIRRKWCRDNSIFEYSSFAAQHKVQIISKNDLDPNAMAYHKENRIELNIGLWDDKFTEEERKSILYHEISHLKFSTQCEFRCDDYAVKMMGPESMISALKKVGHRDCLIRAKRLERIHLNK